jgi:flagellar hook-associated protein 1 FlgK
VSIGSALSVATGGLKVITSDLSLVSQNVANAGTPNYAVETATQTSLTASGQAMGVQGGPARRQIDLVLQGEALTQNATVTNLTTRQSALQAIDAIQGTPGAGNDLTSLLNKVQTAFSTLQNTPDSQPQQSAVVEAASNLATGINTLSTAYQTQRQAAQNDLVSSVTTLNAALGTIGQLSDQIIAAKTAGQSIADLENQRDAALQTVSKLVSIKVLNQSSGDVVVSTTGGLALPIRSSLPGLIATGANLGPGASYPGGGIPGVMLGNQDVTGQLTGGQIGADITLRDTTMPTFQGELDEFAQNLASRFDAQGLTLFTDPAGNVPASNTPAPDGPPVQTGYVGFSGTIEVNPSVSSNPTLVRDGTHAVVGDPNGAAAFTPNPVGGPAGFTTLIANVLNYTLGTHAQPGVPQPASNTQGLGPNGNLNAPYAPPAALSDIATSLTAAQSQASGTVTNRLGTETAVQTSLTNRISSVSGVSIDTEVSNMIQLQNAYGANAKVISAVQALFSQLLAMVQ